MVDFDKTSSTGAAKNALPYDLNHPAPFIYFDNVTAHGAMGGVVEITLEARRLRSEDGDKVTIDRVMVAQLRANVMAMRVLRAIIDQALLIAERGPETVSDPTITANARLN